MKIAIDGTLIERQESSIGIFQLNIVDSLLELDHENQYLLITTEKGSKLLTPHQNLTVLPIKNLNLFLRNRHIKNICDKHRADIYFATFNITPNLKRTRIVLQNHDFSHGKYSKFGLARLEGRLYNYLHIKSIRKATYQLANSSFTALQTKEFVEDGQTVVTACHDCDPIFKYRFQGDSTAYPRSLGLEPYRYILYAGRVSPEYKNISQLLRAFGKYSQKYPNEKLVIVFNDSLNRGEKSYIKQNNINALLLKNIPKAKLKTLYINSKMFVYPSSYEGFGSPILEAQNCGCPLIANKAQPLPEIGGEGAIYFNNSEDDLLEKMLLLASDPSLRERLIKNGYSNAAKYDWKKTALATLRCFDTIERQR